MTELGLLERMPRIEYRLNSFIYSAFPFFISDIKDVEIVERIICYYSVSELKKYLTAIVFYYISHLFLCKI